MNVKNALEWTWNWTQEYPPICESWKKYLYNELIWELDRVWIKHNDKKEIIWKNGLYYLKSFDQTVGITRDTFVNWSMFKNNIWEKSNIWKELKVINLVNFLMNEYSTKRVNDAGLKHGSFRVNNWCDLVLSATTFWDFKWEELDIIKDSTFKKKYWDGGKWNQEQCDKFCSILNDYIQRTLDEQKNHN